MKRRILSILTALALCLSLLPGMALAAEGDPGVTITYNYDNPVTLEDGGIYVAAAENKGIEKVETEPESGPYLAYNATDGTLTVHGEFVVTARITVNSNLTITGETGSSLEVTGVGPAFQLCDDSAVTLAGGINISAISSSTAIGDYRTGSGAKTFATTDDYSGNIVIICANGPAVSSVALDVKNSASITITGIISAYDKTAVLNSEGNVDIKSNSPLSISSLSIKGANVELIGGNPNAPVFAGQSLDIDATGNVSITNKSEDTEGSSHALTGNVEISAEGNVTISSNGAPVQGSSDAANLTVKNAQNVSITGKSPNGNAFFLVPVTFDKCGSVTVTDNGEGWLMKDKVTVSSDKPWTATTKRETVTLPSGEWHYDRDITDNPSDGIDCRATTTPICWKAGDGWICYEPAAADGSSPVNLILDNVTYRGNFSLNNAESFTVTAKGNNQIGGIANNSGSVTVTEGDGTLNTIIMQNDKANSKRNYTVYGKGELSGSPITLGSSPSGGGASLTIQPGAELTIPKMTAPGGSTEIPGLIIADLSETYLNNQGTIVNNGIVGLVETAATGANAETVKSLKLSGSGTVSVVKQDADGKQTFESYTNSGTPLLAPVTTLDLSNATTADDTHWESHGYKWTDVTTAQNGGIATATLTLAEGFSAETLKLPNTGAISIVTQGEAHVETLAFGSDSPNVQLTFSGKGPLIFQNPMNISGGDNNSLTVEAGAEVVANGGISIGASGGVNSTVTVNGKLTANGGSGIAIYGGKVAVGDTGVLEVSGEYGVTLNGMPQLVAEAYKDLFTVTGGGRFTANCTNYNVQVGRSSGEKFPEGTVAENVIVLGADYIPDDCKVGFSNEGKKVDFIRISTGEVYSGPLTIHKNHTWKTGWTWDGTNHWHACEFAGCTEKQPGSEAAHFYRSCVCTVCSYQAPAGTPDSNSGGVGGGGAGGSVHAHVWETEWTTSETHHWHECTAEGCDITVDSDKGDYGAHVYDSDQDAECNTCGYRRTVAPPTPSQPSQPSGGGSSVSTTYAITVEKSEHGKVTSSRTNASSGSTVTLTVTPDGGYVLDTLTVTDSRGGEIRLTAQGGGKYAFTMPGRAVTVKAAFSPLPDDGTKPCDGGADCPSRAFPDLDTGSWYHEAVDYVLRSGLMNGYGNGLFGPNDMLTRAQFAQVLFNKEGRPVVNYPLQYSDAAAGAWYAGAVRWATSQGIVCGYGNGTFGPDDPITREQLAVMLWRYAGSPAATDKELHFNDTDEISGWALEALRWAVEKGIISGKGGGVLDPAGTATRAETAQMLKNFLESM